MAGRDLQSLLSVRRLEDGVPRTLEGALEESPESGWSSTTSIVPLRPGSVCRITGPAAASARCVTAGKRTVKRAPEPGADSIQM